MGEKMNNLSGKEWLQYSFSIWRDINKTTEERQLKHPAMFPAQLAERLIQIYTREQGEVILDPFLGVGSTLKAAYKLGKKGIGIDLSSDYIKISKKRITAVQGDIFENKPKEFYKPEIHKADSRNLDKFIKPESVDLVVTSPPYWDILNMKRSVDQKEIRNYSESNKDLGNIADYELYLHDLKKVYQKVYEVLKPNKRCCCVVMDIRKKDKFYPLHEDQTRIMKEIGFEIEEYVIWDRQKEYNNMKTLGYPYVFRFNKVHEFICIYWKR
jgi:DNA modification methylase